MMGHLENCDIRFTSEETNSFSKAGVGSYFIIPLRVEMDKISEFNLQQQADRLLKNGWKSYVWQYDDLYNHVNEIFQFTSDKSANITQNTSIGINFYLPVADALKYFDSFYILNTYQ